MVTAARRCELNHACPLKLTEPGRQQSPRHTWGSVCDLGEGGRAEEHVAKDDRSPSLSQDLRSAGDGAILAIGPHAAQCGRDVAPALVQILFFTNEG
jgi:hypothetical protein